jgi:DNA-binding CsgD family transcriptional regulator
MISESKMAAKELPPCGPVHFRRKLVVATESWCLRYWRVRACDREAAARLSPAQRRISLLVAQAHPNREIARRLKIEEQSVRNELSRIFKKMHVRNRVELALWMKEGQSPAAAEVHEGSLQSAWPVELKPPTDDAATSTRPAIT